MSGQEIMPQIRRLQKIINSENKWGIIRGQKKKLSKSTGWSEKSYEDLIIFNSLIFNGTSNEGKIIWSEIHENLMHQLIGVIKNPEIWILQNRFWLNSNHVIKSLGLKVKDENGNSEKGEENFLFFMLFKNYSGLRKLLSKIVR